MKRWFKWRWAFLLLALAAGVVVSLSFAFRQPPPPPIVVLDPLQKTASAKVSLFARIVPLRPSWYWLWRLKGVVTGAARRVDLEARVISFPDPPEWRRLLAAPPDLVGTNGLQVWLLTEPELKRVREACAHVPGADFPFSPRISTADGIGASLYHGAPIVLNGVTNDVGLILDCFTRVHRDSTDLTASLKFSEALTNTVSTPDGTLTSPLVSVRTNLHISVRVQIPRGSGVFLLDAGARPAGGKQFGVILSAKLPAKK